MAYQRAQWHSDLVYEQTCDQCKTTVRYMDDKLGFRPWFADGFIYCPKCNKPLRHSERYAVNSAEVQPAFVDVTPQHTNAPAAPTAPAAEATMQNFCPQCGEKYPPNARFCAQCGAKRE